jgi:hypothetical protein
MFVVWFAGAYEPGCMARRHGSGVSGMVGLLTGELDQARCEVGCEQDILATVAFHDSEGDHLYVAPGDHFTRAGLTARFADFTAVVGVVADHQEFRRVVRNLTDRRVQVFLPVITGGTDCGRSSVRHW